MEKRLSKAARQLAEKIAPWGGGRKLARKTKIPPDRISVYARGLESPRTLNRVALKEHAGIEILDWEVFDDEATDEKATAS